MTIFRIFYLDSSGNYLKDANGNNIVHTTPTITGTSDWTRVSSFIEAPSQTASIRFELLFFGTGKAYFDGVQMVYGRVLDEYYSNENASMEWGSGPDTWTLNSNLEQGDGRSSEQARRGIYSFKVNGSSLSKSFGQHAEVDGKAGEPLVLSGWAYSTGANVSGGDFGLRLVFENSDGTTSTFYLPFDKSVNNQWQFVKGTFRAPQDFNRVRIWGYYNIQTGAAYFDNIKLEERSATTSKEYDEFGNFVKNEKDEFNALSQYQYDANGNLTESIDSSNKKTEFRYNPLNLLTKVILWASNPADNIEMNYEYDAQGNLKKRIDPRGKETTFTYNEINKSVTEIDPISKFIEYDYDEAGNLKSVKRGKGTNILTTETFEYDRKNRLSQKLVNGNLLYTNTYNHADNKTEIILPDGKGTYSFDYDANSRLTLAKEPNNKFELKNEYDTTASGDGNGERIKYTETIGTVSETTEFKYDILKRVMGITGPKGGKIDFFYDEKGNRSRIKIGSSNIYQDFDDAGRLVSQTARFGSDKSDLKYSYESKGQLKTYTEDGKTQSYTYDFANRLTSWNNNGVIINYSFDKAGNLLNSHGQNLTFNDANEIIGFDYDDAGNLTKDNKYIYTWDQEGRLTSTRDLNNNLIASYTYHPDGLRKTKTVGTVNYNYHYDGSNLIRITDNSGTTLWSFTWDGGKPVSAINQNGWTYYYITNFRGDVVRIVNQSGTTVATYEYDPWGKVISASELPSVENQPLRYAGYYYDVETSQYYLQARYYDPETARFISRDPDGGDKDKPLTQNLYAYCNGDSVNNVDPDGRWAWMVAGAALNMVIYAATHYKNGFSWRGLATAGISGAIGGGGYRAIITHLGKKVGRRVALGLFTTGAGSEVRSYFKNWFKGRRNRVNKRHLAYYALEGGMLNLGWGYSSRWASKWWRGR